MEEKTVVAAEYYVYPCDDIGFVYFVTYICPYCGKEVKYSGLDGFKNEFDPTIFSEASVKCEFCDGYALAINPEATKK